MHVLLASHHVFDSIVELSEEAFSCKPPLYPIHALGPPHTVISRPRRAWYSRELGKLSPNGKLSSGELEELSPNGQPSWGRAWYSRKLGKLSPNRKPSSGELRAGRARRALSKWITFVGESFGELGTHGSSGKAPSNGKPSWKRTRHSRELGKLSPNGKPLLGELGAWIALSKWNNLYGGELGTHGSSGSSLPMENLRRESSELESSKSSLQMDNLRGGELGTQESSESSLPMENLHWGALGAGGAWRALSEWMVMSRLSAAPGEQSTWVLSWSHHVSDSSVELSEEAFFVQATSLSLICLGTAALSHLDLARASRSTSGNSTYLGQS
ncbi:hypothetical protein Acr_00g0067200 [Actinidia rufa]|uniref:Uncharacterized protein n=1 Tax=Actinidia rufa TaxID=165716 RepID=A0A7J0DQC0_9ERIC|nr:hypothetical protein Acr_00g0067200 [Actinidia rufa]